MKIYAIAAVKGGSGKTATAAGLAQAGAAMGARVLAIDLDPQANLTDALAADPGHPGSYDVLTGNASMAEAIQSSAQGMDVMSSTADMATIRPSASKADRLARALLPVKGNYDLIVIDTPTNVIELQNISLQAAQGLIIPLEADRDSLQGMYAIIDRARHIMQSRPGLSITGALITRYDARGAINPYLRGVIMERAEAEGVPYLGEIRASVKAREARALQQSLFEYAPGSKPAEDYLTLYKKIMEA